MHYSSNEPHFQESHGVSTRLSPRESLLTLYLAISFLPSLRLKMGKFGLLKLLARLELIYCAFEITISELLSVSNAFHSPNSID